MLDSIREEVRHKEGITNKDLHFYFKKFPPHDFLSVIAAHTMLGPTFKKEYSIISRIMDKEIGFQNRDDVKPLPMCSVEMFLHISNVPDPKLLNMK